MDGNEYSDLLVGAYNSDRVIYMRSRPVVQLNAVDISYNIKSKKMDLKTKSCTLLRRTPVACVPLTLCLEYSGQGVDGQQQYIQCLESSTPKGAATVGPPLSYLHFPRHLILRILSLLPPLPFLTPILFSFSGLVPKCCLKLSSFQLSSFLLYPSVPP